MRSDGARWHGPRRPQERFAVEMLDINRFREFNDRNGHEAGFQEVWATLR